MNQCANLFRCIQLFLLAPRLHEFMRFCVVGVCNTTINYIIYLTLLKFCHFHYLLAGAIAYLSSAVFGFMLNRKWTFKADIPTSAIYKYLIINVFSMLINASVQYLVVKLLSVPAELSQLCGIVVTTFINYFLTRHFVFKHKPCFT